MWQVRTWFSLLVGYLLIAPFFVQNFLGSIEPPAKFFTLLATGGMIAFVSLENVPVTVHDLEPGAQHGWTGSLEGR